MVEETKKKGLLAVVAAGLMVIWGGIAGAVSLLAGYAIDLFLKRKEPQDGDYAYYEERHSQSVEQLEHLYGEPDDVIVVDATRAAETDGVVMVYRTQRFFVIAGRKVAFDEITDVTFHNASTPYAMPEYVVVVTTRRNDLPHLQFSAGLDTAWAGEIVGRMRGLLGARGRR